MNSPVLILYLEDNPRDAELVRDRLQQQTSVTCELRVASDRAQYEAALAETRFDLILSDFKLPDYDGMSALALALAEQPGVPFIMVSGTLGEEHAVDCMLRGATDFVLKQRLERLVPAVLRALTEAQAWRERRRAEQDLQESKDLVDSVVENVPLMIFLKEAQDLRFVVINKAGEELLGYDRKDLLGKNNLDLFPPEQAAFFMARDREVLAGGVPLDIPEEPIQTAKKGRRLLHTRKVCIKGADGVTKYLLGISEDITERKQAEEEHKKLEAQMFQAQKMESVGQLAGGVAHDFNNLLTAILGYTVMAMDGLPSDSSARLKLAQVQAAGLRAADLTRQLLLFSRRELMEPLPLDVNRTINNTLKLLRRLIGEDIAVTTVLSEKPWIVRADEGKLEQVIMNLAVNARDAMLSGGNLTIATVNVHLDAAGSGGMADSRPGDFVRVSVTDTGTGIDERALSHLFEPFFTTKAVGKGTGLGLSVVHGIAKQHEGWIHVTTQLGKGTTFAVYLPALPGQQAAERPLLTRTEGFPGKGERVLVIEDDAAVRDLAEQILTGNGYEVVAAGSLAEGLRLFEEQAGRFELVFSDVVLPDGTGLQVVDQVRAKAPGMPVLLASGYTDEKSQAEIIHGRGLAFLRKPYDVAGLLAAVRKALARGCQPVSG